MTHSDKISDERLVDFIWQELCEMPDRSSPEDYPDMALVNRDDLLGIMDKWAELQSLRAAQPAQEGGEVVGHLRHGALLDPLLVDARFRDDPSTWGLIPLVRQSALTAAREEVERLREALEPLSNLADLILGEAPPEATMWHAFVSSEGTEAQISLDYLRRARSALSGGTSNG